MRMCACRGTAGFAHVSCLVEQAKILCDEVEENNLGPKALGERWARWDTRSLCEQMYHGVVLCALGWACWKTYVGRRETDPLRRTTMHLLGNGLHDARHYADELSVREAHLSLAQRIGASEDVILGIQGSLANTYSVLERFEQALLLRRDVYTRLVQKFGEEDGETLLETYNYAITLLSLRHFEEARSLLRKTIPVARRVLGENHERTLKMRMTYASSLYKDDGATLDEVRESVTMLEDTAGIARRVLGGAHPLTIDTEHNLKIIRAALHARDGGVSAIGEAVEAMKAT